MQTQQRPREMTFEVEIETPVMSGNRELNIQASHDGAKAIIRVREDKSAGSESPTNLLVEAYFSQSMEVRGSFIRKHDATGDTKKLLEEVWSDVLSHQRPGWVMVPVDVRQKAGEKAIVKVADDAEYLEPAEDEYDPEKFVRYAE